MISHNEGNTGAIDELARSAMPRFEYLRQSNIPHKIKTLGIVALTPFVAYLGTHALNNLFNVPYPEPRDVGLFFTGGIIPAFFIIGDELRLLRGHNKNLYYNPELDVVVKLDDIFTNKAHGFHPLLLGESPFLLEKGETRIIPLRTHYASIERTNLEATIDGAELLVEVPRKVSFEENSDGIGAIKRTGEYGFKLLAFAPYDSFLK